MRKLSKYLPLLLVLSLILSACGTPAPAPAEAEASGAEASAAEETEPAGEFNFAWNDVRTFNTLDAAAEAGYTIAEFNEDPKFTAMVEAGDLPPLAERLPENLQVVAPYRNIGKYGGTAIADRDSRID